MTEHWDTSDVESADSPTSDDRDTPGDIEVIVETEATVGATPPVEPLMAALAAAEALAASQRETITTLEERIARSNATAVETAQVAEAAANEAAAALAHLQEEHAAALHRLTTSADAAMAAVLTDTDERLAAAAAAHEAALATVRAESAATVAAAQQEAAIAARQLSHLQVQLSDLRQRYDDLYVDAAQPQLWQIDVKPAGTARRVRILVMASTLDRAQAKALKHTPGAVVGHNGDLGVIFTA